MEQLKTLHNYGRGSRSMMVWDISCLNFFTFSSFCKTWHYQLLLFWQFDRQSSIRFSSQRARTLQSLQTMFEVRHNICNWYLNWREWIFQQLIYLKIFLQEEDLLRMVEESACLQRTYEKYIDYVIVNEDHDETFRKVVQQLETLNSELQWVPVNWVYWAMISNSRILLPDEPQVVHTFNIFLWALFLVCLFYGCHQNMIKLLFCLLLIVNSYFKEII